MSRDRWRLERDLAARSAPTGVRAARNARGRALVDDAIAAARDGAPPPAPAVRQPLAAAVEQPAALELVSCPGCYAAHPGLPGSLCPTCTGGPA